MQIALIADIHGNLTALDAVLEHLDRDSIHDIICLGDVAIFGPQPRETLARIRSLGCPVIMGNTDSWALTPAPHPIRNDESEGINALELWGAAQLTDADRAFIRTFQPTIQVELTQGETLLCYHGSPRSYDDSIIATTGDEELGEMMDDWRATFMVGGHTHMPFVRRWQSSMVFNPGSVGLPYEILPDNAGVRNPPWAEYAVLSWDERGIDIDLRRVGYDLDRLLEQVRGSEMPYAERWAGDWR